VAPGCMDLVDVNGEFVVGEKLYRKVAGTPLVTATMPNEDLFIASIDLATYTQTAQVKEIQRLVFRPAGDATSTYNKPSVAAWTPFALTFTDEMGQKYTTRTIADGVDATWTLQGLMDDIELAIEALPNAAVPDVQLFVSETEVPDVGLYVDKCTPTTAVPAKDITLAFKNDAACTGGFTDPAAKTDLANCNSGDATDFVERTHNGRPVCVVTAGGTNGSCNAATTTAACTQATADGAGGDPANACVFSKTCDYFAIDIHFVGNSGDVPQFELYDGANCGGISACDKLAVPYPAFYEVTVSTSTGGTTENSLCSSRGTCDYTTGDCKCFQGFTGVDCSKQNVLAMY